MYAETWVLHTHPSTPQGPCSIILRGAAVEANVLGRNRRKMAAMLADREKLAKVCQELSSVLWDTLSAYIEPQSTLLTTRCRWPISTKHHFSTSHVSQPRCDSSDMLMLVHLS